MIYIEAVNRPKALSGVNSLFLAGGITGCPDWQEDVCRKLDDTHWIVLNPRRKNFPIEDKGAAKEQITWEHDMLRLASARLFWFPCETLCPIVLFELGAWSMRSGPLFVGVHPDYARRQDVEIQLSLARPDVKIVYDLEELVMQVRTWAPELCY